MSFVYISRHYFDFYCISIIETGQDINGWPFLCHFSLYILLPPNLLLCVFIFLSFRLPSSFHLDLHILSKMISNIFMHLLQCFFFLPPVFFHVITPVLSLFPSMLYQYLLHQTTRTYFHSSPDVYCSSTFIHCPIFWFLTFTSFSLAENEDIPLGEVEG